MHTDIIAVLAVGVVAATRIFVSLVDWHYQQALNARRSVNEATRRAEEKLREKLRALEEAEAASQRKAQRKAQRQPAA